MGQQGRYIGRVGALAVALGVGGVIAALPPTAAADTGNSGKTTSSAGKHAPRGSAKPSGRTPKAATARPYGALSAASRKPVDRLGTGNDPAAPVTTPLSWAVAAATRREFAGSARLIDLPKRGIVSSAADVVPSADDSATPPVSAVTASPALDTAVRNFIDHRLPGWKPIADELAPIVADGIQDLLTNGSVSAEVNRLVTNTAVMQFFSSKISAALGSYWGVPPAVGTVIGDTAANLVRNTLGNAGVQSALDVVAHAVMPTPDQYGAITAGLTGGDVAPLRDYLTSMIPQSAGQIATFLGAPTVQTALASAVSTAVVDLTRGPEVPGWLGDLVASSVSAQLSGPAGSAIGAALGDAVQSLLSNTKAMQGLATVVGAAVTNILSAPGVSAALGDAITQFGTGYLGGQLWVDALDAAWQQLLSESAFLSALPAAASNAVSSLATNTGFVTALGATVTALVNDVADDAAVQAYLGALLGPTYGPALASALADPESAVQLAATAGSVVTSFLGQAGVATALSTAATQIATALLAGATLSDAVLAAFETLQADAAVVAAFNATVPAVLEGVLKAPAVQQVVSVVAQGVVADLLDRTALSNSVLQPLAGTVTKAAVDSLVSNPAAQDLIGGLAGDLLNGVPATQLVSTVISAVMNSQDLQVALGMAVGSGIGALFGDNPIGFAVGKLAGAALALFFGMASGAALLFNPAGSAAAASSRIESPYVLIGATA